MPVCVTTPPFEEIVTLAEARAHLRLDEDMTDEDALLLEHIRAARMGAEHRCNGRAFGVQERLLTLATFPCGSTPLVLGGTPATDIYAVRYRDSAGAEALLPASAWTLDRAAVPSVLYPAVGTAWPATDGTPGNVRIEFECGHTATEVPGVRAWILLSVATQYCQRSALTERALATLPRAFHDGLLDPWRIY